MISGLLGEKQTVPGSRAAGGPSPSWVGPALAGTLLEADTQALVSGFCAPWVHLDPPCAFCGTLCSFVLHLLP